MAKTASVNMEIDSGIKERAMAVLEARGMSLSGAVRRMVTLRILEHRIPFEVTRDPVFAGAGMSDGLAKRCGIDKEAPARTGVPTGMVVKMEPEFKREMRRYCSDMCVTPNGLVHMLLGQVAFELCSEEDAAEYLSERTYFFKVAAYRSLFEKRVGGPRDGQYIDLDFGHLRALASLDRDLRYALLPLTLDVEHAARTKLVRIATERDGEDGYALSRDYMAGLNHNERRRREGEINMMGNDLFCGDLVRKYGGDPAEMPIWVLMELFSFGSFIDLYLFCAERWGDREMVHEHYMLRQAKSVRNACAHSSDVLNGVAVVDARIGADAAVTRALAEAGLSHRVRTAKMKNPRIRQIATLMYLHAHLVPEGSGKKSAASNLAGLEKRLLEMSDLAPANNVVRSTVAFLAKLIDNWFR